MSTKNKIWTLWQTRNKEQRTREEVIYLADEAWAIGLRLSRNQNTHYQMVMDLVRFTLRD
ncbi:hypothetical protein EO763_23110 (plasmid) [Pectobacterium odoriferum]|uniref:hypothetical protein n=1 Tax=Pectobacterium odoriferum TaxID=78398 RepID=UPI00137432AF|nr:hypothetical protein [Pectobacterium odoriferum]QHP82786.1 hypothetical protein EO763_23110 [Pectobacterium odoriferum]